MRRYQNYQSMQRGSGLGSILGKMFRFARPLLSAGFKAIKPQLMQSGKETVGALLSGQPVKKTLIKQGKKVGKNILKEQLGIQFRKPPAKRKTVHMKNRGKKTAKRAKTEEFDPFN